MPVETRALNRVLRDNRGETPSGPAPYGDAAVTLPIFCENGEGEPAAAAAPFVPSAPSGCASRGMLREGCFPFGDDVAKPNR
jgi:hypothetical protein